MQAKTKIEIDQMNKDIVFFWLGLEGTLIGGLVEGVRRKSRGRGVGALEAKRGRNVVDFLKILIFCQDYQKRVFCCQFHAIKLGFFLSILSLFLGH